VPKPITVPVCGPASFVNAALQCRLVAALRQSPGTCLTANDGMQERVQSASRVTSEQSIVQRLETLRAAFTKIEAVTGMDPYAMVASSTAQHHRKGQGTISTAQETFMLNGLLVWSLGHHRQGVVNAAGQTAVVC